jgi:AN1-type zinc finger protein 5/6
MAAPLTTKKNRCGSCSKKLGLIPFTCKCGGDFCAEHRYGEKHNCSYDYTSENKRKLSTELVKVVGEKIERI